MSKRIPIYHYISIGLMLLTLFLPYRTYDLYAGGFWQTSSLIEENVHELGMEVELVYGLIATLILTSVTMLVKRNLATAIIGLIMSFGMVLFLPLLAFALTFHLFGPSRNEELGLGYMIAVVTVISYFGFAISHLVYTVKQRKEAKKNPANQRSFEKTDLLDDF